MNIRYGWGWFAGLSNVARLTFRREFLASIPLAIVISVLEATFCGFVARKGLNMPELLLAVLMACHMTGLLLTGPLIGFFQQTRKITALSRIILFVSFVLISVSFLPRRPEFNLIISLVFIFQILLSQIGMALAVTLRSSIWRSNYPLAHRGKIVILIYFFITITKSLTIFGFTRAMESWNLPFQAVYGICGSFGLLTAFLVSRIRIHREKRLLRSINIPKKGAHFLEGLAVLKSDPRYREFLSWQMLNGFSTLIIDVSGVLVLIITDVFEADWFVGGSTLAAVPMMVSAFSGLLWARVFDRSDIFLMRFIGALGWAVSRGVLLIGIAAQSIEIVIFSRVITGLSMGVGQLTWRLGHMHFSTPEKDHLYMAAHISLTGIRGILTPFIGILLYKLEFLGPHGIGIVALAGLGQLTAAFGFLHMRPKKPERTSA